MVKPNHVERRRQPRVRFDTPIELAEGPNGLQCQLKDISAIGAAVFVNRQLAEMELLGVRARIAFPELPTVDLDATAIVVRCDPAEDGRFELGLFFNHMSETSRSQLVQFLEAMSGLAVAG